jgi:hypothetical protein
VLYETAALLEAESPLTPPAEAAFVAHFRAIVAFGALTRGKLRALQADETSLLPTSATPSASELDGVRRLSQKLIRTYLEGGNEPTNLPETGRPDRESVALQYAEAVLRQEEVIQRLQTLGEGSPLQVALPEPDRERANEFLLYRNLRGPFETLDSLLTSWEQLVDALQDHAESVLYEEYDNWLTKRDSLEDALLVLSPASRKDLEVRVRVIDEGFVEVTQAVPTSVKPAAPWRPQRWWWYRVPARLDKHFQHRVDQLRSGRRTHSR